MMVCKKGDSIILDKFFKYGVDDLDKQVFEYVVEKRLRMVFIFLKYRIFKDLENEYKINKMDMRFLYRQMFDLEDSYDGLNLLNLDFKKKFFVNLVYIKWQDFQYIDVLKEDILVDISCYYNFELQVIFLSNFFVLFVIIKIDIFGNKIGFMFFVVFFKLLFLYYLNLFKNQIKMFFDVFDNDYFFVCLEELLFDRNKIEVLLDYLFKVFIFRFFLVLYNSVKDIFCDIWEFQCLVFLNLVNNMIVFFFQSRFK